MFSRLRRRILPRKHRPGFEPNERVLAWAVASNIVGGRPPSPLPGTAAGSTFGGVAAEAVIATNLGLWMAGSRTPWHEISKAVWDGSVLIVTASRVVGERDRYSVIEDLPPVRLVLVEPNHLPHQIRLRVTSSVRHSEHHAVSRGGVWLAARRVPGIDGLSWIARYDPGTDGGDPDVAAQTDALFRRIFTETHWRNVGGPG